MSTVWWGGAHVLAQGGDGQGFAETGLCLVQEY
jgi:hypothetical protein